MIQNFGVQQKKSYRAFYMTQAQVSPKLGLSFAFT